MFVNSDFVFIYLLFLSTHRFVGLDKSPDLGWNIPVDRDQTDRSWPAHDLQLDLRYKEAIKMGKTYNTKRNRYIHEEIIWITETSYQKIYKRH